MNKSEKLLYSDPEAARRVTVSGWVDKNGRFYGDNEHMARWSSCTHMICECGNERKKGWTICKECRDKKETEKYNALEFKEWDGDTPLYSEGADQYFFGEDEILDHCEEYECSPDDLMLIICRPGYASCVEYDHWHDDLPEGMGLNDVAPELAEAVDALNKLIDEKKFILSWFPGKYRTTILADGV